MIRQLTGTTSLEITSSDLIACFSPEMGGRLLELRVVDGPHIFIPTKPHSFAVTSWPRAGAYPLVPYHNRLENAQISVGGETFLLEGHPAAPPHTLHGPGHTQPWTLVSHGASELTMKLDYHADAHWSWPFEAIQSFCLDSGLFKLSVSLRNTGEKPMPGGLAWHPYFASAKSVSTDARYVWPHREDYLPTGECIELTDRPAAEALPTLYLQDWRKALVSCADGYQAEVSATSAFDCLIIHRGDPAHICVEPATHVPSAWNLPDDPEAVGARILHPGEVLEGSIEIRISK
ncbi:hypothetical protein ACFFP0_23900 [Rhizobium puerariae]|uniref:Aldose 1-epimerase n=1 Tax=Rhizobium puerariae TaxID=1585791 RepID=A0ABV6AMQ8_9HYPH